MLILMTREGILTLDTRGGRERFERAKRSCERPSAACAKRVEDVLDEMVAELDDEERSP